MKGAVKIFQVNGMKNNNKKTDGTTASAELKKNKAGFQNYYLYCWCFKYKIQTQNGKKSYCKTTA